MYLVEIYGNFEGSRCIRYQDRIISQKLLSAVIRHNLQNEHSEFSSLWQQRLVTETLNSAQMYEITHAYMNIELRPVNSRFISKGFSQK